MKSCPKCKRKLKKMRTHKGMEIFAIVGYTKEGYQLRRHSEVCDNRKFGKGKLIGVQRI